MTTPPLLQDDPYQLLRDLRGLVGLHQAFGIEAYPAAEELTRFLNPPDPPASPSPMARAVATPIAEARTPAVEATPAPSQDPQRVVRTLAEIEAALGDCCRPCPSGAKGRVVFGGGNPDAGLLLVGDLLTPGDEAAGTPFTGEAGELLTRMLKAIGLDRDQVYLTTLVKCRLAAPAPPPADQVKACLAILISQIEAVGPKVICTLGQLATQTLLHSSTPLLKLRGRFHDWHRIPLLPTFAPDFLLKNPEMKRGAWADLQQIQAKLKL